MWLATQPRFMIAVGDRAVKSRVPVRLSFLANDQARQVLLTKTFFIDGIPCTARLYTERPPIVYCRQCSSIGHRENSQGCKGPRCEICTSGDHTTESHQPSDPPPKCINCAGTHPSCARECPARKQPPRMSADSQTKQTRETKNMHKGNKDIDGFTQIPLSQHPTTPKRPVANPYTPNLECLNQNAPTATQNHPNPDARLSSTTPAHPCPEEDSQMIHS